MSAKFTHADILAAVVAANEATIAQYNEFIRTNTGTTCAKLMRFMQYQRDRVLESNKLIAAKLAELDADPYAHQPFREDQKAWLRTFESETGERAIDPDENYSAWSFYGLAQHVVSEYETRHADIMKAITRNIPYDETEDV